jgi:hypothetical protein
VYIGALGGQEWHLNGISRWKNDQINWESTFLDEECRRIATAKGGGERGRHRVSALARRAGTLPLCRIMDFFFVTFLLYFYYSEKYVGPRKPKLKRLGPKPT